MATTTEDKKVLQPIHPDFISKLLPEYIAHHNATTAFVPPIYSIPWDPAIRKRPAVAGTSEPLTVGSIRDVQLANCTVRVFTPEGTAPEGGWPVFIFFHGGNHICLVLVSAMYVSDPFYSSGGWCLGNIDTENSFSTRMCKRQLGSDSCRLFE